jgi:hypothetical protein
VSGSGKSLPSWLDGRASWAIVAAITLVGLIPRLVHFQGAFLGDELSTLYIVEGQSLGHVFSVVSSDAEISPPLYFVLAWLFSQASSVPELVRLPALLAGIASIPLTYMVGARALGRPAGLIAAAAMALNPFMVFYSTDGRAYSVAIALLLGTTLTMLIAVESGRLRWWVAYGALTCLCMYAHYTTAFVLGAQLLWLLWAHPEARRVAILVNVAAAIAFLPWLPSMMSDFNSPTIDLLSRLQGDGFSVKLEAVEAWAFGYPYSHPRDVPGYLAVIVASAGLLVGVIAGLWRWAAPRAEDGARPPRRVSRGVVLVVLLALATPVAELVLLELGGSDLFGARNLLTASPGFALAIGAIAASAGLIWGSVCTIAVIGGFSVGSIMSLQTSVSTIDLKDPAELIDAQAAPGDVVVDIISAVLSPVPLTGLDVYKTQRGPEFRIYLPEGSPPFLSFPPPPAPLVREAIREARGHRLYLVVGPTLVDESDGRVSITLPPAQEGRDETEVVTLGPSWHVVEEHRYEGISDVELLVLQQGAGNPG